MSRLPVPDALRRLRSHPMAPVGFLFVLFIGGLVLAAAAVQARNDGLASGVELVLRVVVQGVYLAVIAAIVILVLAFIVFLLAAPSRGLAWWRRRHRTGPRP